MKLDTLPRYPTNNYGGVRERTELCVWHCTAGGSARGSMEWLARPNSGAGYHFLIDRDGTVTALVPLTRIAWHAGLSAWPVPVAGVPARSSVNAKSVGVSFANWNVGVDEKNHETITEAQIAAGVALAKALAVKYPALNNPNNHVRHRDVAPGRKSDPLPVVLDWLAFRTALEAAL